MLPMHRKEKVEDDDRNSNNSNSHYTTFLPAKIYYHSLSSRLQSRLTRRQIHIIGILIASLFIWLLFFRSNGRINHHRSPYAATSHYLGPKGTRPIVDVTIEQCTRWTLFQKRSKCTNLIENGWQVSGGDLLLDKASKRVHLFVKREELGRKTKVITDLRVAREKPIEEGDWEYRTAGIWIKRGIVRNVKDAVTAIDFIHGAGVQELRRGRQFVKGGPLLLGKDINLSYRLGPSPPRVYPRLKATDNEAYKVLQVAGKILADLI